MKLTPIALGVLLVSASLATASLATPPPCDRVRQALQRGANPETVAKELDTTRARINACAKIGSTQERMNARRLELQLDRRQRGLDH